MNFKRIWDNYCCYCGREVLISSFNYTKEHLIPKSKGGNNLDINKKTCCKTCNNWRGNHSLNQFKKIVKFHINNNLKYKNLNKLDFEIIIENIDYWVYSPFLNVFYI